eukprot:TRINITY_DN2471_c0_g3_i4.p1 TRINITY_DN2471_c0_g3~~TRINITY_DN2471_c0_g3_i4.p1  ORF type:complete len:396 (+),score=85.10 TRINITY_DN2471_c0_g3_i4:77-1264(+)
MTVPGIDDWDGDGLTGDDLIQESLRRKKVESIFLLFDENCDGRLSRDEFTALLRGVDPSVGVAVLSSILDQVFRTYAEFIEPDTGISFDGLLRTYTDSGQIDREFSALGFAELTEEDLGPLPTPDVGTAKKGAFDDVVGAYVWPGTKDLVDDLLIVLKRNERGGVVTLSAALSTDLANLRKRADELSPSGAAAEGLLAMGKILLKKGLLTEALEYFLFSILFAPNNVQFFWFGRTLHGLKRLGKAQEEERELWKADEAKLMQKLEATERAREMVVAEAAESRHKLDEELEVRKEELEATSKKLANEQADAAQEKAKVAAEQKEAVRALHSALEDHKAQLEARAEQITALERQIQEASSRIDEERAQRNARERYWQQRLDKANAIWQGTRNVAEKH